MMVGNGTVVMTAVKWPRRGQISGERSEPGVREFSEFFGLEEAVHIPFVYGLFEAG